MKRIKNAPLRKNHLAHFYRKPLLALERETYVMFKAIRIWRVNRTFFDDLRGSAAFAGLYLLYASAFSARHRLFLHYVLSMRKWFFCFTLVIAGAT